VHFAGEDSRENDERWAHRVGRRPALLTALVFSLALAAYLVVPCNVASNDNYSHALTALSLARGEWGRLDNLRRYWASPALGHRCTVIETPDGGAVAGTGFGVALAIAPLYLVARAAGAADETVLADSFNFAIAAVLTALAVALFFTAVLRLGDLRIALFSTGALALGTSLLSVLSRELWQHTLVVVLYAGVVFLLLRRPPAIQPWHLAAAGFLAGWAAAARATGFVFFLPLLWLAIRLAGRRSGFLVAGFAPWLVLSLLYNWWSFGSPFTLGQFIIGAYRFGRTGAGSAISNPAPALAGLLFSPGRGLFIYSPILLVCVLLPILLLARRRRAAVARSEEGRTGLGLIRPWLVPSAVIIAINVGGASLWKEWAGGWTYGPRYLSDALVFWGLLLAATLIAAKGAAPRRRRAVWAAAWVSLGVSITFHGAGLLADAYAPDSYSARMDPDRHPERMWDWSDFPPLYNLRLRLHRNPHGERR
jgi:hypothetical protein